MNEKRLLGDRLRSAREKMRLSQIDAAKKIGIHNSTLGKYELAEREPDIETIKKLAELYEVKPEWLLVGLDVSSENLGDANKNDSQITIRLIEDEARKMGLSPTDPVFKKMLSDAFELLRLARGKDTN